MTEDEEWDQLMKAGAAQHAAKVLPPTSEVSTPVNMDPRPQPAGGREIPPDPSPSGPLVDVRGVALDATSPQTRDVQALDITERNLRSFGGSLAAGGVVGKLASKLPGIAGLLGSGSSVARGVGGALEGAAGGAAATAGGTLAGEGRLPTGNEVRDGAILGGAAGAGSRALGGVFAGAPARNDSNILADARASGMGKADYAKFFGSREGALRTLRGDPELRGALGNADKTLELTPKRFAVDNAEATKIMDTADAKNGRIPGVRVDMALNKIVTSLEKAGGTKDVNSVAAAAQKLADQFASGPGANPAHPAPTAEIRRFLSEEVGPKLNTNPNVEDNATSRAARIVYGRLKDMIGEHVGKAAPELATKLETLNEKQATYRMLEDAAKNAQPGQATPGAPKSGGFIDTMHKAAPYMRAGLGAEAGKMAAHAVGVSPEIGAAVGGGVALAAPVIRSAAGAVGRGATAAMATRGGQLAGRAMDAVAPHAAHVLVPKIVGAIEDKDPKAAAQAAADAVYGP